MRGTTNTLPLLVGETNHYGGEDPTMALYPYPAQSAGYRLCHVILNLTRAEYLRRFERRNLCAEKWRIKEARLTAAEILASSQDRKLVLLGSKVCEAFDLLYRPFVVHEDPAPLSRVIIVLPHPSGRSRGWNQDGSYAMARDLLLGEGGGS